MRSEIEIYVTDNYSLEKCDLLKECFTVFETYDLEDYENSFIDLLMEVGNKDVYQGVLEFELLVKNTLLNLLHVQGIQILDDADLSTIKEIARCILEVQHYEDKESILNTLDADFFGEEKLCELFRFVSDFSVDRFIVAIDSVDEGIFIKLREIYTEEIVEDSDESAETNLIRQKLRILKQFLNYDEAVGFKLIRKSASIGLSFNNYFFYIKKTIDELSGEIAAKELMVLLVMSGDTHTAPLVEYSVRSSNIFIDIDKISKVNVILVKLFSEYEILVKNILNNERMEFNHA